MAAYSRTGSGYAPVVPPDGDRVDAPGYGQPRRPRSEYDTCFIRNLDVLFLCLGVLNPLLLCILVCGRPCHVFPMRTWVFILALILLLVMTALFVASQLSRAMVEDFFRNAGPLMANDHVRRRP